MKRATASTQMLGAAAASALAAAKTSRIATNRRLRSTCDSAAVSKGPDSITVNANRVTSWPAADTEMDRSRASSGSSPTIRNSVETMTKAATARMAMESVAERAGTDGDAREVSSMDGFKSKTVLNDIGDRISYLRYLFHKLRNLIP